MIFTKIKHPVRHSGNGLAQVSCEEPMVHLTELLNSLWNTHQELEMWFAVDKVEAEFDVTQDLQDCTAEVIFMHRKYLVQITGLAFTSVTVLFSSDQHHIMNPELLAQSLHHHLLLDLGPSGSLAGIVDPLPGPSFTIMLT